MSSCCCCCWRVVHSVLRLPAPFKSSVRCHTSYHHIHHSLVALNSIKTSTNLYNSCRLYDSLSCTLVTTTDYGIKYLLSPSRKSGGFTRRHCPSVCLSLFVCRICRRHQACPTCFLLGEKLSREIYASGGGLLVVSINASHLFLDRCAVACCTAIK